MKNLILISLFSAAAINPVCAQKAPANIRLTEQSMMHESRVTPSPLNGAMVDDRFVSFQWPLPAEAQSDGAPMDGFEHLVKKIDKSKLAYKIRYAQDSTFKKVVFRQIPAGLSTTQRNRCRLVRGTGSMPMSRTVNHSGARLYR